MEDRSLRRRVALLAAFLGIALCATAWAVTPKESTSFIGQKAFFKPELYISSSHEQLEGIVNALPNRLAWEQYLGAREAAGEARPHAFIDPRSGAASSLIGAFPIIPGSGVGNRVSLQDVSVRLGRAVAAVDSRAVADLVRAFIQEHRAILAVDTAQLGEVRAVSVTPDLWQISVPQVVAGIPVRHGRIAATINHGNLVLIGTESWGNVRLASTKPKIDGKQALAAGFAYLDGMSAMDEVLRQPALEVVPVSAEPQGKALSQIGAGYKHRLVWTFEFQRLPDDERWEVMVDAHSGEVLAVQDLNHYVNHSITGGVYPLTNTGICPTPQTCGTMQSGWPMPFADTGLASPNNFTNSGGIFDWTSGTTTTTLTGRFVDIVDNCGAISNSSTTGSIDLGGTNNQHDCTTGGGSAGNTPASRSAFYEVNKIAELARGWLPTNTWLNARLTTNVNLPQTCNAFWSPAAGTINFYRSGGGCRNTGEIARGVRPRVGPRHGRQRRRRGALQLERRLRRHRRHLPPAGLLRRPRLLPDHQRRLRHDRRRHRLQHQRGAARGRALRPRLLRRTRRRLPEAQSEHPRYGARLRLHLLPDRPRAVRPAGTLRRRHRRGRPPGTWWPATSSRPPSVSTARRRSSSATSSSIPAAATSAPGTPAPAAALLRGAARPTATCSG